MFTKNHNHMMYGSWDTEWDRQNFLSFWAIFCPFTTPAPTNGPEKQNSEKKWKKMPEDIILLHIHKYHKWSSGKQSDPGHFLKSHDIIFLSFPYTLFIYFWDLKNYKLRLWKDFWVALFFTTVIFLYILFLNLKKSY